MAKTLLLSNYTMPANSPEGTVVGSVTNKIASSTLTLIDNAGDRVKLVDLELQAGSISSLPGVYLINIKEQNSMASQITQIEITII